MNAATIIQNEAFIATALPEAIRFVAKKNNQPVSTTIEAYRAGVPSVMHSVESLMQAAAEELAKRAA